MTLLTTPPQIIKQYRPCWFVGEESCYVTVTAEGSELVIFKPGEFPLIHFVGGVCVDCAMGLAVCEWPDCPRRNRPKPDRDIETKDAEVDALFRLQSAPIQDPVQDTPAPVVEPAMPVVEPAPPVSFEVQRAAMALAIKVWASGSTRRDHLFHGLNPGTAEKNLAHAVAMRWVIIDGDRIAPGSVSPHPMEALPGSRSPRGMWSPMFQ